SSVGVSPAVVWHTLWSFAKEKGRKYTRPYSTDALSDLSNADDAHLFAGRLDGDRAVASFGFGAVERLIGGADHLVGRGLFLIASGDANTHGNVDLNLTDAIARCFAVFLPAPVFAAHGKDGLLNHLSHRVQIGVSLTHRLVGKHDGKFFSSVAERLAAPGNGRQLRSHHAQGLVAGVMSIAVVEFLEIINVQHSDAVRVSQLEQGFVQGASAGQLREFVAVRHGMRGLKYGDNENQSAGGKVNTGKMIASANLQGHKRSHQRPEQAAFYRLVFADQGNNHCHGGYHEGQQ